MFAFGNPVVGGSTLVRPAIQSPGFASGSAGWRVARDGSAEFNNVVIRGGSALGGTDLFYSGVPALGNLVGSISAAAGVDPSGNAYVAGNATYAAGNLAISIFGTGLQAYSAPGPAGPWTPSGGTITLGAANFNVFASAGMSVNGGLSVTQPPAGQGVLTLSGVREWYAAAGDPTGAADYAALSTALGNGYAVDLLPGSFYLKLPLAWSGAQLAGCGDASKILAGSLWSPGPTGLLQPGASAAVRNLLGYGGSTTRSANPQAHFITPTSTFWRAENIRCDYMNGNIINCAPVTGSHGTIFNVKGEHNGGGVSLNNGAGAGVTAEINIGDLDIQNCELNPVLLLSAVNDIRNNGPLNGSVIAGAAVNCITVEGACQSIDLGSIDVGGGSGAGVLVFAALGGNSPTDCQVRGGVVQDSGGDGVVVSGACARLSFTQLMSKGNQGSGWTLANTGAFNTMTDCAGNTNNKAAGVAYDVNVTGTGHWKNEGFGYVSGAVTAGRFLAAGNNYTESNPPASMTTAGAAPGGW